MLEHVDKLGEFEALAELCVEALGVFGTGAGDGVLGGAQDAAAGEAAGLGGGAAGVVEALGKGDGAADAAGDAVEGDGGVWCLCGRVRGRRFRGGLGLWRHGSGVDLAGEVVAHADQVSQDALKILGVGRVQVHGAGGWRLVGGGLDC